MIFVAGTMKMNPSILTDFEKDVAAMRDKVLAEDGCHHYSLLIENAEEGIVNVMEMWRDDAALLVHFTMPWIGAFFAKFSPHMLDSTVQIYDIAGEARPLPAM